MINNKKGNIKIIGMRIYNNNKVIVVKFKVPIYICIFYKYKIIFLKNKNINNKFVGVKILNNSDLFYGLFKNSIDFFKIVDYNIDFLKENEDENDYMKYIRIKVKNKYKDKRVDKINGIE